MTCPNCFYTRTWNGWQCDRCGYQATPRDTARQEAELLAKVREARSRSEKAVEWYGIEQEEPDV